MKIHSINRMNSEKKWNFGVFAKNRENCCYFLCPGDETEFRHQVSNSVFFGNEAELRNQKEQKSDFAL